MGFMSNARVLSKGANLMMAAKLLPEITRLVKQRSKDDVAAALESDEAMTDFARGLYKNLRLDMRQHVPEDGFIELVKQNRQRLMSKKKNQKKVEKHHRIKKATALNG